MIHAYVVTEGAVDAKILQKLLPKQVVEDTEFVAGAGKYSAHSLAVTLLALKQRPLALVIDADTNNQNLIQEQRSYLQELLRQAASDTRFEIFAAVPTLESIFFQDRDLIEQALHRKLTESEWETAKSDQKITSEHLTGVNLLIETILANLTDDKIHLFQQHPLISKLNEFLSMHVNGKGQQVISV
jgi:hypothetical protein